MPQPPVAIFVDVNNIVIDPTHVATFDWHRLWLAIRKTVPGTEVVCARAYVSAESLLNRLSPTEIQRALHDPLKKGKFDPVISKDDNAVHITKDIAAVFFGDLQKLLAPIDPGEESRVTFPSEYRIILVSGRGVFTTVFNTWCQFPDTISFELYVWAWRDSFDKSLAAFATRSFHLEETYGSFDKARLNPLFLYNNLKP